jgi:hypothetical protein
MRGAYYFSFLPRLSRGWSKRPSACASRRRYLVVRSSSLVISMLPLTDRATGQESAYIPITRSTFSRSFSSAVRWKVCFILLMTSTFFSVSTSPTVSA